MTVSKISIDSYRILFTRSVGDHDAHLHLGVSAEPEMNEHKLNGKEKFLVLASDGIWDYISNDVRRFILLCVVCFELH